MLRCEYTGISFFLTHLAFVTPHTLIHHGTLQNIVEARFVTLVVSSRTASLSLTNRLEVQGYIYPSVHAHVL